MTCTGLLPYCAFTDLAAIPDLEEDLQEDISAVGM